MPKLGGVAAQRPLAMPPAVSRPAAASNAAVQMQMNHNNLCALLPLAMGMAHPAATGTGRARWTGQRHPAEGEDDAGARREDPNATLRALSAWWAGSPMPENPINSCNR